MQTAIAHPSGCCSTQLASRRQNARFATRTPAFSSTSSRARSVQVYAKGKGKRRGIQAPTGPAPGMTGMQMQAPPVPEVDLENEEFVVFLRAKSGSTRNWVPLSIVKGGQSANVLVKTMESDWGKKLYSRTLVSNIAQAVYKDKDSIIKGVRANYPPFKDVPGKDFEFAFKIRDKSAPKDWLKADGVTPFPPESELTDNPIDKFKKFFDPSNLATMFGAGDNSPATQ